MLGKAESKIWRCAIAIYLFLICANPEKAGESAQTNKGRKTFYYAIKPNDDNILRGTKEFVKRSRLVDRLTKDVVELLAQHVTAKLFISN